MTSSLFFQNTLILRRTGVVIFTGIIVTMFIKQIIQVSRKVKRITNYVSKSNLYLYFLMQQILLISGEKMLMPEERKGFVT